MDTNTLGLIFIHMALVLPNFIYGIEFWGGDLKIPRRKVFERGTKMHMMSHVKVSSSTSTYHILLVEVGELPIELHALKPTIRFQQHLTLLFPSWLVCIISSFSR
jgi:hypothetical protein